MHGDDATERKCAKCGAPLMDGELYPRLDFDREFCTRFCMQMWADAERGKKKDVE